VFVENAKKFGTFCGKNPTVSIVTAAERFRRDPLTGSSFRSKALVSIAKALDTIATGCCRGR
jgi:hypothetical protein